MERVISDLIVCFILSLLALHTPDIGSKIITANIAASCSPFSYEFLSTGLNFLESRTNSAEFQHERFIYHSSQAGSHQSVLLRLNVGENGISPTT